MTISFSGLASGLDTTSWIQSLTALRQARVNTLTAQKEKISVSQNALSTIKSYFTNFRSSLEKLTDAKFGISSIDLFTQNLATTTNTRAFTATATTDAEEKDYKVKVNKLATNTKAKSTYISVVENKTTAVQESKLKDVGIRDGEISVFVDGVEKGLFVSQEDTLGSLVAKFQNIGVSASYNQTTGVFNINASVSNIKDDMDTGIVSKLNLVGVNEAYQSSNKLQVIETRTDVKLANLFTKLSDLDEGYVVSNGDYVYVENASGEKFNITLNEDSTIGDFITALKDVGLYATFDTEEGIMEISGGRIIGGTFDARTVFGLTEEAESAMSTGKQLSETIMIPEVVTLQTRLVEDMGVAKGYFEITKPDGTKYYEKISQEMTMSDLMADMGNLGINTSLDPEKGILTVTGGSFRTLNESEVLNLIANGTINESNEVYKKGTNLLVALGFDELDDSTATVLSTNVRSQRLTYQRTDIASAGDLLSDYFNIPENNQVVVHEKTGEEIGTVTVNSTTSFGSFFAQLSKYDVDAQIHDGKILIDSNRELYLTGDVVDAMGMETTFETTVTTKTVGKAQHTLEKTYNVTEMADNTSVIDDFMKIKPSGSNKNNEIVIKDKDGNPTATVTVTNTTTFGDLFNELAPLGVTGRINDGVLSLVHNNGGYVDGSFTSAIGMITTYDTVVTTTTVGGTQTTASKTFSIVDIAGNDSVINDFLTITGSNNQLTVKDIDGHVKGNITVTNQMTFRQLFAELSTLGVNGDINDGQLTFVDNNGGYVDGSFAAAMGVATTYTTITTTTTVGGTQTTASKTFRITEIADDDSVISNFLTINDSSNKIVVKDVNGNANHTVTVTNTMTFRDLFTELSQYGVYGGISDGKLTLYENNGGYVDGSFCQSMGMSTKYTTVYTTTTTGQQSTGAARNYTVTYDATGSTTFNQIGSAGNKTWTILNGQTGAVVASGSFADTTTIGQFADLLGQYGMSASIDGGYFTASSPEGLYVKGTAADALGLQSYTYTMSGHGTYTATVAATDTQTVNQTRTLDVASSGLVTIAAQQTITVNQTRTLTANSSGYATIISKQTITTTISQTLAVTTTQNKTITTTIVTTMTISQAVTGTAAVTFAVAGTTSTIANQTKTLSASATIHKTVTTTSTTVQTVAITTTGSTTMNVTRTMTVDVSRTVAVNTTGYTTVNIAQTLTINATQTTNVNTTGKTTVNISQTLTITAHQTVTVDITDTRTVTANKSSGDHNTYQNTFNMSGTTKLSDVGLDDGTITVVHNNAVNVVSLKANTTVDSIIGQLAAFGVEASVSANGAMTFKGTNDGYIIGATGSGASLGAIGTYSTSTTSVVFGVTDAADQKFRTITQTMTGDTTFANLSLNDGSAVVNYQGQNYTISMSASNTMYDFMAALSSYGISAAINNNGEMTVTGTNNGYVVSTSGGISSLGINTSTVKSTSTVVNGVTTAADRKDRTIIQTMTSDTTLAQLKWNAGTVKGYYQGKEFIISMETNNSIGDLITALAARGVTGTISNDGKLTLTGSSDGYITEATGGLSSGLGIVLSTVKSTSTVVNGVTTAADPKDRTVTYTMTGDTTFADLNLKSGTARVNFLNKEYTISMNENNTMNDFMTALGGYGISANIRDGIMYVTGTNDGYISQTSGSIKSLGINTSTQQITVTSTIGNNSTSTVFTRTTTHTLDRTTKLSDIEDINSNNVGITTGSYYIYRDGVRQTQTITADMTVNDLMAQLAKGGLIAEITESGSIAISGRNNSYMATSAIGGEENSNIVNTLFSNWVFDKIYDSKTTIASTRAHSQALTIHQTNIAETTDVLSNYVSIPQDGKVYVHEKTGEIIGTVTVDETSTFRTFFGDLAQCGIDAQINDGQILFDSNRELYVTGELLENLGMSTTYKTTITTTTVGKSQTTTDKHFDIVDIANNSSVISNFITISNSNNQIVVKDSNGAATATVMVSASATFGDIFNELANHGVTGQMNNGIMTLVHNEGGYVDGSFTSAIGMTTTYDTVVTTTTVGGTQTTSAKNFQFNDIAGNDSIINDFLTITGSNNQLTVKDIDGHVKGNVTVTNKMTFRELFAALTPLGVNADINDGQMTFTGYDGSYVDGSFAAAMGVATTYTTVTTTTTVGGTQTTASKTFKITEVAKANSVINNFNTINNSSNKIVIKDVNGVANRTVTVTNTMTFNDLFDELSQYGVYGGLSDGVLTLYNNDGGYVDGSFCQSMGMTTQYTTVYTTATVGQTSTGAARNYTVTYDATGETTFKQIGSAGNKTWTILNGQTGAVVASGSFADTTTIGQFANLLGQYGMSAGIDGGYFTASSPEGMYVKGTAADALGLQSYTYTMSGHGTYTATIAATDTQVVNQTRTLSVASSGLVTVAAQQTLTINQTRTLDVASSGYVTITAKQTITTNFSQTLAVTTTQNKTITTTVVTTMTFAQNATATSNITYAVPGTVVNGIQMFYNTVKQINTNVNLNVTVTRTSTSVQTLTLQTVGTTTMNVSRTITVDVSRTVLCETTGKTTVNIAQTLTINATQTTSVNTTGSTTVNIAQTITVTAHQTVTVDITDTRTVTANKSSGDHNTYQNTFNMSGTTKLSDVGLGDGTITVVHNNAVGVVSLKASSTVDSIIGQLAAYGVEASVSANGAMTFKGTNDGYIIGATGSGASLGAIGTYSTSTTSIVHGITAAANQKFRTITQTMTGDTTFANMQLDAGSAVVNYQGQYHTINMTADNTMYDFMTALGGYGISAIINSNGQMTVTGTNDGYISSTSGGIAALGISTSTVKSSTTVVNATNTAADRKDRTLTLAMTNDTTLSQLGWNAGTVKGYYQGNEFSISMQTNNSIGDLMNALASRGISSYLSDDGKLTITGSSEGYITEATGGLYSGLGIVESTVKSTSTVVHGVTSAANSKKRNITVDMDGNTTFANLGLDGGTARVNFADKQYIISMNENNTMNDFMTALSGYGISAFIKDGRMTVTGTNNGYVLSTTGGIASLGITTSTQQSTQTTITGENGISSTLVRTTNPVLDRSSKLSDLQDTDGNNLGITTGAFYVYQNGTRHTLTVNENWTVNDLLANLVEFGFVADLAENGSISISAQNNTYLQTSQIGGIDNSNIVDTLFSRWDFVKMYGSNELSIESPTVKSITRNTRLDNISSDLDLKEGVITIIKDGVRTNLFINQEDTVGTFIDELAMHGFETVINDKGQLIVKAGGDSRLQNYENEVHSSNILDILGINANKWVQANSYESKQENVIKHYDEYVDATENTVLSSINNNNALETIAGDIEFTIDGIENIISIDENETVGSVLDKFRELGIEATISNGKILIQSGYKDIDIVQSGTTSALGRINSSVGLDYFNDIGGYSSSNAKIISTTYEDRDISVSKWADMETELSLLNITSGTFSVFSNGQKAIIEVNSDDTFATLQAKIQNKLGDVQLSFENGYLSFSSNSGNKVTTGSSTDTSNLSSITGLSAKGNGTRSSRELYKVSAGTTLTTDNIFRNDNITEGTFTIGEEEYTIDSTTTLNDIINMINNSENSGATAYWDSVEGKLILNSRTTGAKFVNIEKGTSNFTDVMGLTSTKDGITRMNTKSQKIGSNAEFTINGTSYTSTSNTINSDISRIKGVTIQLKAVSTDEESIAPQEETLMVEKDRETLANALEEVVDSYNQLMDNVDKAISAEGDLKDQTALKMIRNQLRSLVSSSQLGLSTFRNLDSIGVTFDQAAGSNISTKISNLTFDRDKFYKAFNAEPDAVKALLVGTDTNKGVLTKIEDLVESALTGVTGYFDNQNNSYIKQIQQINERISKENRATSRYQEILESKFSAMDLLISQMQQQYSSFLIA